LKAWLRSISARHAVSPAPVITTKSLGIVRWRGWAGAVNYSVERSTPDGEWELVCDKCAIDSDMGWPDLSPGLTSLLAPEPSQRVLRRQTEEVPHS
jgi:hypothetical protein